MASELRVEGPPILTGRRKGSYTATWSQAGVVDENPKVMWKVVSDTRGVKLHTSRKGAVLDLSSPAISDSDPIDLRVALAGDAGESVPPVARDFTVHVKPLITVVVGVYFVQDLVGGTRSQEKVREQVRAWTKEINTRWSGCGVRFRLRAMHGEPVEADARWFKKGGTLSERGIVGLHDTRPTRHVCIYVVKDAGSPSMTWARNRTGYAGIVVLSDHAIGDGSAEDAEVTALLAHELGHAVGGLPHLDVHAEGLTPSEQAWSKQVMTDSRLNAPDAEGEKCLMAPIGGERLVSDIEALAFYQNAKRLAQLYRMSAENQRRILLDQAQRGFRRRRLLRAEQLHLVQLQEQLQSIHEGGSAEVGEALSLVEAMIEERARASGAAEGYEV